MNVFNGGVYTLPDECVVELVPIPLMDLDEFQKCWGELLECIFQSFGLPFDLPVPDLIVETGAPDDRPPASPGLG